MDNNHSPPTRRRPGIAIVRPKLHEDTPENRALFRRWTKLHMRDTLSLPHDEDLGGASRMLRYTRSTTSRGEEYFYTIVLDDVRLPGTEIFQSVPQRLDLENTRELGEGEEPVLREGDERAGTKPMVFSIVKPVVGIFEEVYNAELDRVKNELWTSYQTLPGEIAMLENAPRCRLVTLTFNALLSTNLSARTVGKIHSSLVSYLATATQTMLYTTLYTHSVEAQPGKLPEIAEGEHGRGNWVACVLVGEDADSKLSRNGLEGVEGQVEEWFKRIRLGGAMEGVDVKTGVWKGDLFMS
ncbi:hypothetical protein SVAN01_02478 [Stagonosporopsis vannaccii]|nr:hypothetical protein SVAN01_02478 [Stagonosporopsis vannaccii]